MNYARFLGVFCILIPFEIAAQLPQFKCESGDDARSCVRRFEETRKLRDHSPELVISFIVDKLVKDRSLKQVHARAPVERKFLFVRWQKSEQPVDQFDEYVALNNIVSSSVAYLDDHGVSVQMIQVVKTWHGFTPYTTFIDTLNVNADNCEVNRRAQRFLSRILNSEQMGESLRNDLSATARHLRDRQALKCDLDQ